MLTEILKQFNWVDIFVAILLFRICYISLKSGLVAEFFKLLGTLLAVYLSLHYYTLLSDFIRARIGAIDIPLQLLDFLSFTVLAILGYVILILFRSAFSRFIKIEAVPKINQWGGLALGIFRSILFTGLITFMLTIFNVAYLEDSAKTSYLGSRFLNIAPDSYSWFWNNLTSKFMTGEGLNENALSPGKGQAQK